MLLEAGDLGSGTGLLLMAGVLSKGCGVCLVAPVDRPWFADVTRWDAPVSGEGRVIDNEGATDETPSADGLGDLAELVRSAAAATAVLWRANGLDGDRTIRLVEVSHALQRASLALSDAVRIGGSDLDDRRRVASGPASAGSILHGALRDELTALLDEHLRVILDLGLRLQSPKDDGLASVVSGTLDKLEELTARGRRAIRSATMPLPARTAGRVEVPVGLVWFDGSGAVEANAAWTALTGLDRAGSLGDGWLRAFQPGCRDVPSETVADAMREGVSTVVDWPLSDDADGRWISATIHASPSAATMAVLDLTDRVARERDLTRRANHDRLTGLANRDLLVDRVTHALARLERHPGHCALLFIDLDAFKGVNDRHGHRAGDRLLAELGLRMREAVRPSDTVARLGGDEFVVLCEDLASEIEAVDIGQRLLAAILTTAEPAGVFGRITASIGVAFATGPGENVHELIDRADRAMYEAKARGGNTIYREPARTQAPRTDDRGGRHRAASRDRSGLPSRGRRAAAHEPRRIP